MLVGRVNAFSWVPSLPATLQWGGAARFLSPSSWWLDTWIEFIHEASTLLLSTDGSPADRDSGEYPGALSSGRERGEPGDEK